MSSGTHSITRQVQPPPPLRIGVRAHDFGCLPAEELARRIAAGGFTCVQLALHKAIAGLNLRAGDLTAGLAREIGAAFARHSVHIEVLGCYINPIHPDPQTRRALLAYFEDHLRLARDFGCGLVGLESGSVNPDYSPHPANHTPAAFADLLGSLEILVRAAERHGVNLGLEAVTPHVVGNARVMRQVLDHFGSNHLKVIFDPVNLLDASNVAAAAGVVNWALDLVGDAVAVIHAKDFVAGPKGLKTVPAGQGTLNYLRVLQFAQAQLPPLAVLLEEAGETAAPLAAKHLQQTLDGLIL